MLLAIILLTLMTSIPTGITIIRTCVPNTHFLLNDRLCYCNNSGESNDAACHMISRRQACRPGQIIWEDCRQCICQDNGNLLCTNTECTENRTHQRPSLRSGSGVSCTPFHSYYFNCTLCVCPAPGKMSEARCATDSSCTLKGYHFSLDTILQNICIPKVMYLFTCLHCLCSDDGVFLKNKCIKTCHESPISTKLCNPKSFYKRDCNICLCPESGLSDGELCSKSSCTKSLGLLNTLSVLRKKVSSCIPHKFTKPRCFYCECNSDGFINDQACLEQACFKKDHYNYESIQNSCSPGEMVPTCMECFCSHTKFTTENYCTKVCSYLNKLTILETVMKEKTLVIDRNITNETSRTGVCEPDSLVLDHGKYCLCPSNGNISSKYCTSIIENITFVQETIQNSHKIDYNVSCEPHTFVKFDCNSCYCTTNGKIDKKWCTSDDCESRKKIYRKDSSIILKEATTCVPGSILKVNCSYCICGSSGLLANASCTLNLCNHDLKKTNESINCEPSSYYTVDCNICFCPSDGIKNVDKCTKNQCGTNFLHSDICSSGELFSSDCNICICPPNGLKRNKICTKSTCSENDISWNKIFRISLSLLGNYGSDGPQSVGPCTPGEQFEVGCKLCVCPDIGLRSYAMCTAQLCDNQTTPFTPIREDEEDDGTDRFKEDRSNKSKLMIVKLPERRAWDTLSENCMDYNITETNERNTCTPGSEYIVRCRICICPYMGSINHFCRPMPANRYCEEAYPGFNFLPMGRRNEQSGNATNNITIISTKRQYPIRIHMPHNHTVYRCTDLGRLQDNCYICDCKNNILIQEHCFKSDAKNCTDVLLPSFLNLENKL